MSTRSPTSTKHLREVSEMIARLRNWRPLERQSAVMGPASSPRDRPADQRHQFAPTDTTDRGAFPLRALVIDKDPNDCRATIEGLETLEISAVSTNKPTDIKRRIASDDYDLVILDLSIGQNEGLLLLYEIRCQFDVPVIVTAPSHIGESTRAAALELGADDCMTKPFGSREFQARIYAILRRRKRLQQDARHSLLTSPPKLRYCRFGGWQLDRGTRRLTSADGGFVPLTKGEYGLLAAFTDTPMVTLSRERLLQATRVHDDLCNRSIDVQILRLRRKLQIGPGMNGIVRTVRGVGYMFMLQVENID